MSTGMLIDGIFGGSQIDSSGEVLDLKGTDISDIEEGKCLANYEHQQSDSKDSQGQEIVGKVLWAKKIFNLEDCENERERKYFKSGGELPILYGVMRLFDGAGHKGAHALASAIRDCVANGEPAPYAFSVEGSTLQKEGNVLKSSIIRRIAITSRACNKASVAGILEDPNAPKGFDKNPAAKEDVQDILANVAEKHEHPNFQKLGSPIQMSSNPILDEESEDLHKSLKDLIKLKTMIQLIKATEAGSYNAAPGSLVGGAALQVEDRSLHRHRLKNLAMAQLRDYDKPFDKAEFKAFLKHKLPEADDSFIDHFADLAEDYKLKKSVLGIQDLDAVRFEALTIDLNKAMEQHKKRKTKVVDFAGKRWYPGRATLAYGPGYVLLHEDDHRYVGVPEEHADNWEPEHLQSLPKEKEGTHFVVDAKPQPMTDEE